MVDRLRMRNSCRSSVSTCRKCGAKISADEIAVREHEMVYEPMLRRRHKHTLLLCVDCSDWDDGDAPEPLPCKGCGTHSGVP